MRATLKMFLIGLLSVVVVATVIFALASGVRYIAQQSLPQQVQE